MNCAEHNFLKWAKHISQSVNTVCCAHYMNCVYWDNCSTPNYNRCDEHTFLFYSAYISMKQSLLKKNEFMYTFNNQ